MRSRLRQFVLTLPVLLVCACGSNAARDEPRGTEDGSVVSAAEVPEAWREAFGAWMQGGEVWDDARDAALADPELRQFLIENWIIVMGRFYSGRALSARGQLPGPFGRAQRELVALGLQSAPSLIEFVRVGDEVAAKIAEDTLVRMEEPRTCVLALVLLEDRQSNSRRRGANLLAQLPNARGDEERVREAIAALAHDDPEWTVRAQATRALGMRGVRDTVLEPTRHLLVRCLLDPDPAVHEAACRGLATLGDPLAIPALTSHLGALSRDPETRISSVQATQGALRKLSGRNVDWSPIEWERWWKAQR